MKQYKWTEEKTNNVDRSQIQLQINRTISI